MEEEIVIIDSHDIEHSSEGMDYVAMKRMVSQRKTQFKVTVVVLAYEKIEKTKTCVENILNYASDALFELWLVDNGTVEDEIFEYFKSVDYKPKKVIKITKNISSIFAVNVVMHSVNSKYLAIVTNDVIVTKNWLKNLLICAESDPKIGVVCPVSTNISNRQEEVLGGFVDLDEMQVKAAKFNKSDCRKWEERMRVIPTATLYRREIIDEAGVFDIGFLHEFGDDEYSFRVRRAGYKLIVCKDVFVHHNHYLQERDMDGVEQPRFEKGREDFKKKYYGLDAWEDGSNHIQEFSHYGDLKMEKDKQIHILGADTRCGTPILDIKNKLKAEGCFNFNIDAFTTELKYYIDLNSISDSVEHGSISNICSSFRGKKYQFVVLGEALNHYQKPAEILLDLMSLTAAEGVLLFHIYNMDNIYEFLWKQGLLYERLNGEYQRMSYDDVINILRNSMLKKLDISFLAFPVIDQMKTLAEQMAYPSLREGREEKIQNLFVKEYWFWVQKA